MTLCPKCGAMLLVTTSGEICQNCGWRSVRSTGWVSDNTVNLPLIISNESLENRSLETVLNDLTIRVGALEADLERLKKSTGAKFENAVEQIGEKCDGPKPIRYVYIIRERTSTGWTIVGNMCHLTFESARKRMKALIQMCRQWDKDCDANNLNIIQVKVKE